MMVNIFVIASVLTFVSGKQYAYFDNNIVEFDDAPAQSISLPYPYQEPNVVRVEKPLSYGVGVRTAVVSATHDVSQDVSLSPISLVCSLVTSVVGCIKRSIMYVINSIPTLIFNAITFFGVYNLSSICRFFNIEPLSFATDLSSFVTADRIKRATEFVETAIKKYSEIQDN